MAVRKGAILAIHVAAIGWTVAIGADAGPVPDSPQVIRQVERMPNIPQPFKMKDWRAVATGYDKLVFDFKAKGDLLPLIWLDESKINTDQATFGLPSFVGMNHEPGPFKKHEAITGMGAVLGATLAGIDKSKGEYDYVRMCQAYFNRHGGENIVLNNTKAFSGASFWYDVFPGILFFSLTDRYPNVAGMDKIMHITADRWYEAARIMGGPARPRGFDHTAFSFAKMQPMDNGWWTEPDGAAGIAWLEYMAYVRWHDPKYLEAAGWCMQYLNLRPAEKGAFYEVLLPYGAVLAARMNAELGRNYDVSKLLNWCFDGSGGVRPGWGVIAERWGDYDCQGLQGSRTDGGGYAFAMNTFVMAGTLTPLARYDSRYARAIGKYVLNAANAARLFYPDELPPHQQSSGSWTGDPSRVIAYEGLRKNFNGKASVAMGDALARRWAKTDLGLYGSSYAGFLGGMVRRTNDDKILQLDCLAADFFHGRAFATYLYFNPYMASKEITVDVGAEAKDLYDAVSHRFLGRGGKGKMSFAVPADSAVLLVLAPAGGKCTHEKDRVLVDGVVVDYSGGPTAPATDGKAPTVIEVRGKESKPSRAILSLTP